MMGRVIWIFGCARELTKQRSVGGQLKYHMVYNEADGNLTQYTFVYLI